MGEYLISFDSSSILAELFALVRDINVKVSGCFSIELIRLHFKLGYPQEVNDIFLNGFLL
jgi:hypothetical protein